MKRVTLRLPEEQVEEIKHLVDGGVFANRSEGIRTAVREYLENHDHDATRPRQIEDTPPVR